MTDFNVKTFGQSLMTPSSSIATLFNETTEPTPAADGSVVLNEKGRDMASRIAKDLEKENGPEVSTVAYIASVWMTLFTSLPKFTAILKEALRLAKNPNPIAKENIEMNLRNTGIDPQVLGLAKS
jgi:hypothetical protein